MWCMHVCACMLVYKTKVFTFPWIILTMRALMLRAEKACLSVAIS